jgi:hypothetical protein
MEAMAKGSAAPISTPFAKQTSLQRSPKWLVPSIVAVVFVSSFAIYLFFSRSPRVTNPPPAIAISVCPNLSLVCIASRRCFGSTHLRKCSQSTRVLRDMPPRTLYAVRLKDADANIVVWRDDDIFRNLKITYPIFSET